GRLEGAQTVDRVTCQRQIVAAHPDVCVELVLNERHVSVLDIETDSACLDLPELEIEPAVQRRLVSAPLNSRLEEPVGRAEERPAGKRSVQLKALAMSHGNPQRPKRTGNLAHR